jgi:hypothetical protein
VTDGFRRNPSSLTFELRAFTVLRLSAFEMEDIGPNLPIRGMRFMLAKLAATDAVRESVGSLPLDWMLPKRHSGSHSKIQFSVLSGGFHLMSAGLRVVEPYLSPADALVAERRIWCFGPSQELKSRDCLVNAARFGESESPNYRLTSGKNPMHGGRCALFSPFPGAAGRTPCVRVNLESLLPLPKHHSQTARDLVKKSTLRSWNGGFK